MVLDFDNVWGLEKHFEVQRKLNELKALGVEVTDGHIGKRIVWSQIVIKRLFITMIILLCAGWPDLYLWGGYIVFAVGVCKAADCLLYSSRT